MFRFPGFRASQRPGCGDDLQSLTDELNGVAEAMWKDELSKGIKPNASAMAITTATGGPQRLWKAGGEVMWGTTKQ